MWHCRRSFWCRLRNSPWQSTKKPLYAFDSRAMDCTSSAISLITSYFSFLLCQLSRNTLMKIAESKCYFQLDYEVQGIQFPSISIPISGGSLGSGTVNVSDLRIQSFKSPNIKFKLIPRNGIGWKSNGGAVKVYGNWKASYTLVIPIYMSGYVRASANDIRTLLQTEFDVAKLRPQLNIDACSMDVENIDVSIGGGIIPWIVNLFRPELSALIKEEIRSQVSFSQLNA
ncbi:unnamed protein product [Anisakis simplex]|uniref:BPI1 domain-containing protein n=1 Tax=Anisakis simplex TaxID=6269 RepID=A0A0M3KE22_ANISI|nr:unnamed protein product [Anisakis simplex]